MKLRLSRASLLTLVFLVGAAVFGDMRLYAQELPAGTKQRAAEERMRKDVFYLASDQLEGRGLTTAGIELAANHIVNEFKKAGLKPGAGKDGYFQPFRLGMTAAKLGSPNTLHLHGPQGQDVKVELDKRFQVLGMSESGKITAPIVFAGYGLSLEEEDYDDYESVDVAGKVVIVLRRTPYFENPSKFFKNDGNPQQYAALNAKMANAHLHKAAAVIFVNDQTLSKDEDALMSFNDAAQQQQTAGLPAVHVLREVVDTMLKSRANTSLDKVEKEIDRTRKPQSKVLDGWTANLDVHIRRERTPVKNVIGVLEGSGPLADETVVIGAHYDHLGFGRMGSLAEDRKPAIYHGADDNSSGTSTLLELARRLGAMPNRPGRRLVFMAFTAEESGLLGSAYYCEHPLFPLDKTAAMVNLDTIGRLTADKDTGKDLLTVYGAGTSKNFGELLETLNKKHDFKLKIVPSIWTGVGSNSDQTSFYLKKVPILFFFTGVHPDVHQPSDTADKINVVGMRRIADLVEEVIDHLERVTDRPSYVELPRTSRRRMGMAPRLGITPSNDVSDKEGVLIQSVAANAPASKAGLRSGDRIIAIDGRPIKNRQAYIVMMCLVMISHEKGEVVDVDFIRDGKKLSAKVKL